MISGGMGQGGPDWGRGRRGKGKEPDGTGNWGQQCQMAREGEDGRGKGGPDGSCGRGVMAQEGQMAGVVGQEADGREQDGAGAVGQEAPDTWEEGDGRVHEHQIAVAGGSGVAWSRSSRWWAGRGQIRRQGAVRGQIGAAMARGGRVLWARWWWCGTGVGYQTGDGMGFQTPDGILDSGGVPVMGGIPDTGGVLDKGWWGTR